MDYVKNPQSSTIFDQIKNKGAQINILQVIMMTNLYISFTCEKTLMWRPEQILWFHLLA